ncbi:hypothetical protein D1007_44628 [Hordeum vulgare]|nr:hypothetical protein D1007_44628 [Hordeum vulgare]
MDWVNAQAVLLKSRELLRYRPKDAGYCAWLTRITQLVNAAGESLAPSLSLRPPPSDDEEEAQQALMGLYLGDRPMDLLP